MPFTEHHLFFDLDRTLWDFDKNSEIALRSLFETEELAAKIGGFEQFHKQYVYQNAHLWKLYGKYQTTFLFMIIGLAGNAFLLTLISYALF